MKENNQQLIKKGIDKKCYLIILVAKTLLYFFVNWEEFVFAKELSNQQTSISSYVEFGRRSTTDDYLEEDNDRNYRFYSYQLKLQQELNKRISFDASFFKQDKDYKDSDKEDAKTEIIRSKLCYDAAKEKNDIFEYNLDLKYKAKRYRQTKNLEFDQISFAPSLKLGKKEVYTLGLTIGIDEYDYLSSSEKDESRVFGHVSFRHYLDQKNWLFLSTYRIEQAQQPRAQTKKRRQELSLGIDNHIDWSWLNMIGLRLEIGQRNTCYDDENRDDNYDYQYWRGLLKSEYNFGQRLKTNINYQYFEKEYLVRDFDHCGFHLSNGWDYELLNDKKNRLLLEWVFAHKKLNYKQQDGFDYYKNSAELALTYTKKKDWKTMTSILFDSYEYKEKKFDKQRTTVKLFCEKWFATSDISVFIETTLRITDYEVSSIAVDREEKQHSLRLGISYKF
ncbi:MAG: hypothetical protein N2606_05680 [Candidatus Omnitrophica bacterium]|nr:hypothetical protein [Candidatus Omnitrophota bacterium]